MRNLLVVDDEPDLGSLICDAATGLDYSAEAVESADAFKQRYDADCDVIVLDLALPGTDGLELIRYLAANRSQAGIVLMSGCDVRVVRSASRLAEAHGLNVIGAIGKPVDLLMFERLLSNAQPASPPAIRAQVPAVTPDELLAGILRGEMRVVYQPQLSLRTARVTSLEALVRWQHPERGLLVPSDFLGGARVPAVMDALTMAVLDQGLSDLARLRGGGMALDSLAVNVGAAILDDLGFAERMLAAIAAHDAVPSDVTLEITEGEAIGTSPDAIEVLTRLRIRGMALSIDDFGTGHSTMSQLESLPFTELKIDRSFVAGMARNEHCRAITLSMIELAHRLGIPVVAEGVETLQQLELLREMDCDTIQGYLVARPLHLEQLEPWLMSCQTR